MTIPPNDVTTPRDAVPPADPDLATDGRRRTPKRVMFGITLANFGLWVAFFTPVIITFQLRLGQLFPGGGRELALSVLLAIGGTAGILATPLAGRLSDRTTSRFGMRRPWMLFWTGIGLVGLLIEASSQSYPVLVIGGALGQIGFAASLSVLLALLPDHIPVHRRGVTGSLIGFSQALGVLVGIVVGGMIAQRSIAGAFVIPGVVGLGCVVILCVVLPDRRLARADVEPLDLRRLLGSYWVSPRLHPDFGWAWLSRFTIFLAFAGIVNYQIFFLESQLRIPAAESTALVGAGTGLQTLVLLLSSFAAGIISDRVGRRRPFVLVAAAIGVIGLAVLAFATEVPMFLLALALIGLAQGIYYSVDIALATQVLPNRQDEAGKDLAVFTIANQLPQTLAPAVAPLFLAIGFGSVVGAAAGQNYTALFVASAVFALISAFAITRVKGVS